MPELLWRLDEWLHVPLDRWCTVRLEAEVLVCTADVTRRRTVTHRLALVHRLVLTQRSVLMRRCVLTKWPD